MKRDEYGGMGTGLPSLLLIALTACMSVFCALSLLSERGERGLCEKTTASVRAYYRAEGEAQKRIASFDARLVSGAALEDENISAGGGEASFTVPVDENRRLFVRLCYDEKERVYSVEEYRVEKNERPERTQKPLRLYGTEGE